MAEKTIQYVPFDHSSTSLANRIGSAFWTLALDILPPTRKQSDIPSQEFKLPVEHPATAFLLDGRAITDPDSPTTTVFLLPLKSGYVCRSDFIQQRFECCSLVSNAQTFVSPLQRVDAVSCEAESTSPENLGSIVSRAVGAVQVATRESLATLNAEITNRLSFAWLLPDAILPRCIAWVQGREDIDCIERAFQAAASLGIKLVVFDEPGHWLQDPASPWAHLREDFVELDITPDIDLPRRIEQAVRSYPKPIHGIVTISDVRLASVARACQALGLPTESPLAYDIAGHKGRTRMLEESGAGESFVLPHANDLAAFLQAHANNPIEYPRVVKPVVGWCSDCVTKVVNECELAVAVKKASDRHSRSPVPSTTVVIEPYVDGPEVDANFALLDGEIVFCDINDDFPSPADVHGAGLRANFQETQNVMPSALPPTEQKVIREKLLQSMLRQGFTSGLFHCEARVRNSSVEYSSRDGIVDLVQKKVTPSADPEIYLHEINARPAGYLESVAVMLTYGVDYYALRLLLAVGPTENARFRALASPFINGPQFHLSVMIIQQTRAGIMGSPDAAREFLDKHPDVRTNVVDYYSRKKAGDILEGPDASSLWWVAFLSVVSRESRRDLLERVEFVQQNFDYDMEPLAPA